MQDAVALPPRLAPGGPAMFLLGTARLPVVLLCMLAAALLGCAAGSYVGIAVGVPAATVTVGIATLLSIARFAIQSLPEVWTFVISGVASALPRASAQICIASFGVGLISGSLPPTSVSSAVSLNVAGSLPPMTFRPEDSLLTALVFFEENAADFSAGDSQIELLENLIESLSSCLQRPEDRVKVSLRAFASSSGERDRNEELWKARAEAVRQVLLNSMSASQRNDSRFEIEMYEWRSVAMMQVWRRFWDQMPPEEYSRISGRLNRRVEIRVHDAGACLSR
jgi:outer membrane protein OmpA-like peptidoglycan-associated protein